MPGKRSVLLTGGAGFIGSHLARALLDDGWVVDIVDDLSTGRQANLPDGAGFLPLDLTDHKTLDSLPQRDYMAVLHLAGQSSGEKSFEDPSADHDGNARSTLLLATWALERRIPAFLHASSMGVYGDVRGAVAEEQPAEPISWYGASKRSGELILAVAARHGLRACSFRMFSVYGPGQDLAEMRQGMVSIFLSCLLRGEPIVVKGSLDRRRDFLYVGDCVDAWRLALERQAVGALNLGTGVGTTVQELLGELIATAGRDSGYPVRQAEGTPGDQFGLWADTSRVRKALGWEPKTSLREGLESLLGWAAGDHSKR